MRLGWADAGVIVPWVVWKQFADRQIVDENWEAMEKFVGHINSTPRESLNGSTPYDAALETLGKETLNAFQLKRIDPDLVNLTPKLIRFNH